MIKLKQIALCAALLSLATNICLADPQKLPEDNPSLRLWDGTFDAAADATRKVEEHNNIVVDAKNCPTQPANKIAFTEDELKKRKACEDLQKVANKMSAEAGSVRKEQRAFAHVSRASDVVAAGAVAAVAGSELLMKDESQGSSLKKVAKIQEVAGYASYATGATDFGLGAYAYLSQKKKLENIKSSLGPAITTNPQIQTDLENSIEKTKKAAYSHMLFGAGKAAVGFVSMKLAKSNRKEADKLKSISPASDATAAVVYDAGAASATYPTNQVAVSMIDPSTGAAVVSTTGINTGSTRGLIGSSSGASTMGSSRSPASTNGKNNSNISRDGGKSVSAVIAVNTAAPGTTQSKSDSESIDANADTLSGFEVSLTGSGGGRSASSYRGSSGSDEGNPILDLFSQLNKGEDKGVPNSASKINPNELYKDALQGHSEPATAEDENISLFDRIKAIHFRALDSGRVLGPSIVQVRN